MKKPLAYTLCMCYTVDRERSPKYKKGRTYMTQRSTTAVQGITLNHTSLVLYRGEPALLTATVTPTDANTPSITWTVGNSELLTYTYPGENNTVRIVGHVAGTTTVTATCGGKTATCTITVRQTIRRANEDGAEWIVADASSDYLLGRQTVNLYKGAHLLHRLVMPLFDDSRLSLTLSYDSTALGTGVFGSGWYHNFEKRAKDHNSYVDVYNSPSIFTRYLSDDITNTTFTAYNLQWVNYKVKRVSGADHAFVLDGCKQYYEYFDAQGTLIRVSDHEGFSVTVTTTDTLITLTSGVSGKHIYLQKNADGRVSHVYDDSARRQATFTYDTLGRLITYTDIVGHTSTFAYDDSHRLVSETDADGVTLFTNTYDIDGRLCEQRDALPASLPHRIGYINATRTRTVTDRMDKQATVIYTANGQMSSRTDQNGLVTTFAYDHCFRLTSVTDPLGRVTAQTYNWLRRPQTQTDANGNTTTYTYSSATYNLMTVTYPAEEGDEPPTESYTYNSDNQLLTHTDRRGTVTTYTYDTNRLLATKTVGTKAATRYVYENGRLLRETDPCGGVTQYTYNTLGQRTKVTDAENHVTQYTYDAFGHVLTIKNALNDIVTYTYDCQYRKTSVTDEAGNTTSYTYNGNGMLTRTTFADGRYISYTYDGEDRLLTETDEALGVTSYTYDDAGRRLTQRLPDGATTVYTYDAGGRIVRQANAKGGVTAKTYDGVDNCLTEIDPAGNVTTYTYDVLYRQTSVVDAAGNRTRYSYSDAGDLRTITDANNLRTRFTYDDYGRRLTAQDTLGNLTRYTYDDCDRLLTVTNALNQTTTYTYDAVGRRIKETDPNGKSITYTYDAIGRQTAVQDRRGHTRTVAYDKVGNVTKRWDAKGQLIETISYNDRYRPTLLTDAMNRQTSYTYTSHGKVHVEENALDQTRTYTYNARALTTQVAFAPPSAQPKGTAAYDGLGNVTSRTGPLGASIGYSYDTMGRLVTESTPSGGTVAYTYNALNKKAQVTNGRGQQHTYTYDTLGRLSTHVRPEGTVSYTYDSEGHVLTVTDGTVTVTREYDALGRVSRYYTNQGNGVAYAYDSVGNLTCLTYFDDTQVHYTYDENGNMLTVTDWSNRVTTYTYDENNRVTSVTKPNGIVQTIAYDAAGRITATEERTSSGVLVVGFAYTYDAIGRLIKERSMLDDSTQNYTYDDLNRVTLRESKDGTGALTKSQAYTYDAAGNLLTANGFSYTYDSASNRLTECFGCTNSFNLDGHLTGDASRGFSYDSEGRLIGSVTDGYTITYDPEGYRLSFTNGYINETTTFQYDTNTPLGRLIGKRKNGVQIKYIWGRGLIAEESYSAGSYRVYHFDYRGSTVALTDATGAVTDTFAYNTYGESAGHTGSYYPLFRFNGRDGTIDDGWGIYYMRARYYDTTMRRFLTPDRLHGSIESINSLNRYAYANGNPVSNVDPTGLYPVARSVLSLYEEGGVSPNTSWAEYRKKKNKKEELPNMVKAIYVANFDYNGRGLPILGHTQLFFLGENGQWFKTEYNTDTQADNSTIEEKKENAIVTFGPLDAVPYFYDPDVGGVNISDGRFYVVIEGDFTESAKKAQSIAEGSAQKGEYNFFFNNCSDYTDRILKEAKVEGWFTNAYLLSEPWFSIPIVKVAKMYRALAEDEFIDATVNMAEDIWENTKKNWTGLKEWVSDWWPW